MSAAQPELTCVGLSAERWSLVQPALAGALKNLNLEQQFESVCIAADDLPSDGDAWYRLAPNSGNGQGRGLVISCHPDVFCTHQPLTSSLKPPRAIWEAVEGDCLVDDDGKSDFSSVRCDAFLHHHLMTVADILAENVIAEMVPRSLTEAFAAVWAVVVDGRLERQHLPHVELVQRRARFSRLFGTAGILLPGHWQLFQALWDGSHTEQKHVLAAIRQLPRL